MRPKFQIWVDEMDIDEETLEQIKSCKLVNIVGNGCYPFPLDEEICSGVEEFFAEADIVVEGGTTYWLYKCD